jgi:hypothetical protein
MANSRIDSIIYEKVPGKIQERSRFNAPYPGHLITTRTRRGDIIRYKVFVTPMEIIMFMAGGTRDYAAGEEGTRFINSIQLDLNKLYKDKVLAPKNGGYSVRFPAPIIMELSEKYDKNPELYAAYDATDRDSSLYLFYKTRYDDYKFIEEDSFELNIILEKLAEQFTKKTPERKRIENASYPTQDVHFVADKDSAHYHARLVIEGPNYFMMACRSKSATPPTAFFESFKIMPQIYTDGFEQMNDTIVRFTAMVPKQEVKKISDFKQKMEEIEDEANNSRRSRYRNDDDYTSIEDEFGCHIHFIPTSDRVAIIREASPAYEIPSVDSFQRLIKERITDDNKMAVKESRWQKMGDTMVIGYYELLDTNSTRSILSKICLTNERLYIACATTNQVTKPSEFVTKFMETFMPTDTLPLEPILYGKRKMDFLERIYSQDSLERSIALGEMREFGVLNVSDENYYPLLNTIQDPRFLKLKHTHRDWLLSAIGETQVPFAHEFLLNTYKAYPDSARLQISTIEGLARMKTKKAFKTTLQLLSEKPHAGDNLYAIFDQFTDTLSLTAKIYDDLLPLMNMPVYTNYIERITLALVRNKKIKPKQYAKYKNQLIRAAEAELFKIRIAEENWLEQDEDDRDRSSYSRSSGYGNSQSRIEEYLRLLMPFYAENDTKVRKVFDQALRLTPTEVRISTISALTYGKQSLPTKTIEQLLKDEKNIYPLFTEIANAGGYFTYKDWFKDTLVLARSMLLNTNSYSSRKVDSLTLRSVHKTTYNKRPATIYFFDIKYKKDKLSRLAFAVVKQSLGITPIDAKKRYGEFDYDFNSGGYSNIMSDLENEAEKTEFIKKTLGKIRFEGRQRYRSYRRGDDD